MNKAQKMKAGSLTGLDKKMAMCIVDIVTPGSCRGPLFTSTLKMFISSPEMLPFRRYELKL